MARGQVLKRKSGSYAIRYFDPGGHRYYETIGRDRREAERALAGRLRELDTGAWREPSRETLREFAARWLERRDPLKTPSEGRDGRLGRSRLSPSTHREYRRAFEKHILPRLGHRPLATITANDIDQLIAELEERGAAPGTIRNVIVPIRKLLNDAVRLGLLAANPALKPDLPPTREFVGQELPPDHTAAIRNALIALAAPDPLSEGEADLFYVHLFDVALGTGLRLGELRALQWQHIDRVRRLLRVEQAYSRNHLKRPKSDAGIRTIPIFATVAHALDALAARALERGTYAPDELIFQTERGTPIGPSNFNRRVWQPALRHAKLAKPNGKPRYRFHDLRHTTVSRLVAAGADIKLVQTIAGHSNPMITLKRYSHLLDERLTEAATAFDPARSTTTPQQHRR
jgi:integrase